MRATSKAAALPDRPRRLARDDAEFRLGVAGVRLDLEPDAKPVLRRPDGRHLASAVAWNHRRPRHIFDHSGAGAVHTGRDARAMARR